MTDATAVRSPQPWGAIVLLLMALLGVGVALWSHQQTTTLQGPTALGALPDGRAWLVVNDRLWLLDRQGRLLRDEAVQPRGLERAPAFLVPREGTFELYAMVRGVPGVVVIDGHTGDVVRRIALDWPADLASVGDTALSLAVHRDGRMAVANGGGHTVALFSAQGRYLKRTAKGTYRFTNDLWWDGDDLWTTDTNGQALVRLAGDTLVERQRVDLPSQGPDIYTALAEPHPRAGRERYAPLATLARMRNGMTVGRVVHVWADGDERTQDELGPDAMPRDLSWIGETLVVVDGRDFRLRRFDIDRKPLSDLGDTEVTQRLQRMHRQHHRWMLGYRGGLGAALVLFGLGALLAWRSQRRAQAPALAQVAAEARFLGTPVMSTGGLMAGRLCVLAPLVVLGALVGIGHQLAHHPGVRQAMGTRPLVGLLLALLTLLVVTLFLLPAWMRRMSRRADAEGVLNAQATHLLLRTPAWAQVAEPGEHVRETWVLRRLGAPRWVVLSNRRLVVFKAAAGTPVFEAAWHRSDLLHAEQVDGERLGGLERWVHRLQGGPWLRIGLDGGRVLQGTIPSAVTADRLLAQLRLPVRGHRKADAEPPSTVSRTGAVARIGPVLASALVPGLGQWWQGRPREALLLFVLWGLWSTFVVLPVSMTLIHVMADVATSRIITAYLVWLWLMALAAFDAWLFRAPSSRSS